MIRTFEYLLGGRRTLTVPLEERERAFDLMYQNCIRFSNERRSPDGTLTVYLSERNSIRFRYLAECADISFTMGEAHGLPMIRAFLRRRPALLLGALLFAAWMLYSTRIVWDIRIDGVEKTEPSEITELLDELGFGIGTYYPSVDFNKLHARYAAAQSDIAWLSVYMNGTVAEVQVRELWSDDRLKHENNVYANVVAETDGIVEEVRVFEGQPCVKKGDLVRRGQLLISGVIEHKDGSVRYEDAAGEVICRTAEPICVNIRTLCDKKVYTGRTTTKKRIKFFKKSINLFIKGGTLYSNYDKIDTIEQLCPFGLCELPVWYEVTEYREYETVSERIPAEVAAEMAMTELTERLREATLDAELLSRLVETSLSEEGYRIDCLLYLRRDIGRRENFSVSDENVGADVPK